MLLKACPTLASLNIEESVDFYLKLGFTKGYQDMNNAIMNIDEISIHFWKCENDIHPKNTSCYIYVSEIASLYSQMQSLGVIHPNGNIQDTEYGIREFCILDIHGNLIRFGQILDG